MADDGFAHTVNREAEKGRQEFYGRAGEENLAPLWRGLGGLDMHLVNLMDAGFRDGYPDKTHPVTRPEGAADAEFAYNLLPVDYKPTSQTTPIFNYPYARTREALDKMAKFHPIDPCFG